MNDNPDVNRDEIRRSLRDTQRAHEQSLPGYERALSQVLDPDSRATEAEKAGLLGMPDRRGFLKIGGLSVALSAFAVACVYPDRTTPQLPDTGTFIPAPSTSIAPNPGSAVIDATLVLTALSIEWLAIDTYQAAIDGGFLGTSGTALDLAKYFEAQHRDHAGLLSTTATAMGQTPNDTPNAYLQKTVVAPATDAIKGESGTQQQTDTLKLAQDLESLASQTYSKAGGILTTPDLRQAILSIGAIEAKHFSVISNALGMLMVPFSTEPVSGAATPDAYIAPNTSTIPSTTTPGTIAVAGLTTGTSSNSSSK